MKKNGLSASIVPLFVKAGGSGAAEADNGFDAVFPFDQGVVAVAAVKGADGANNLLLLRTLGIPRRMRIYHSRAVPFPTM